MKIYKGEEASEASEVLWPEDINSVKANVSLYFLCYSRQALITAWTHAVEAQLMQHQS